MLNRIDLTGNRYGLLTVLDYKETRNGHTYWKCRCDCGKIHIAESYNLRSGHTQSCGCRVATIVSETQTRHGGRFTRLYRIWRNMRYRCNNPRTTNFERYGGRGISVCKEWDNTEDGFENFRDWALSHGYAENLTIDRINNDGNYEPENCKWSTELEQGGNKRNNINISLNGETHNAAEWSRRTGISAKCIRKRYKKGMNAEKILNIE